MSERKPIPASHCEYLVRMHLKSIETLSKYMSGGCRTGILNGPQNVCVELIKLNQLIEKTLEEYSN